MCAKHAACRSTKVDVQPQAVGAGCSSPKISSITAAGTSSGCCGSSSAAPSSSGDDCCSSDSGEEDSQSSTLSLDAQFSKSWLVAGMDCPACARKIENAISNIDGVIQAKVLFATEKLVVKFDNESLADTIEQVSIKTGFPLTEAGSKKEKQQPETFWQAHIQPNLQIIAIAAAMLFAALLKSTSPQLSEGLFTVTCLLGLYPVAKKAVQLARSGTPFAIETLMSVAALGALYLGETAEAAMVLLLFLIGERLEAFASSRARSGVQALMALVPENATKIINGERVEVVVSELVPGDVIEVAAGSRLPADGQLITDAASFDESALTGESVPVEHTEGNSIMAGAVVVDKVVRITITSKQGENAIDRILHLIEEAESRKAPLERFLDKFSRWYTPLMMVVALLVIITPPLLFAQPWETWVYRGLALLLIACPCALVISTPAAITSGLAAAAKRGALIKGGAALEQLGKIQTIAFDKTGTLTEGKPQVTDIQPLSGWQQDAMLRVVGAIEVGSTHPLAQSLVAKVKDLNIEIPESHNKIALIGSGVEGDVDGVKYQVLSPSKIAFDLGADVVSQVEALEGEGKTVVVALELKDQEESTEQNTTVIGLIAWQDTLRSDAKFAIERLNDLGIQSIMLTGDNPRSAAAISSKIGMQYKASLLPSDKVSYVEELSQQSHVAMVGDGINDAPAMKTANVGIAMGGGTDVALETADSALTHNRLTELPAMIELSQATMNNIRQNVALALGLKGVFLVTSLLGITGLWVAVLADSGATALVTLNALRLLRFKSKAD
ncbi:MULTISPECIES: zinc/cadmium/mercury/lead-transporting ATPase [unclassified Vibrio]|uniref:zinc/cadmium/mercury/lead-transporting ATPase n=1 Tax=unclassified Vibrio TaxID=2614977 RepID=UPI000C8197EA|nr:MULTISPECIES: zinc/cadmium/mercury/lead-transporting ATPase [unclassified Vibrio]PMI25242.1 zinc/cadmium/mercury/lead-transporting ATPase [Vibrio sp. 10N.286.46.E10]PMI97978.1 zinc/cadmium/mercury/lead-transporting ATPase [Vibrio sp. 10N.286.45.E10]PTP11131.1 zinc/cadmium/mercury/lead-transporting ATPase [Vibrio sp. 10N.286.45.A3]PTQ25430.1 zinc/cadmium/mercury/lead-transporting ATPase [Vibrio sp. 10N.286.46.E10]TKE86686.1 zinc/cadmium/mercury/lead-transporting ATPase [Vibrio sp. F12]